MDTVTMKSGRTLTRDVTVYSDEAQSQPYDLTNGTATFELLDKPGGALVRTGDAEVTNGPAGTITIALPPIATDGWGTRVLYGSTVLDEASGNSTTVDEFKLVVQP